MNKNNEKSSRRSRRLRIFWKRNFALLITVPLLLLAVVYALLLEPEQWQITEEVYSSSAVPAELDNLRIAFIADIHAQEHHLPRLQKIIKNVNDLKPDLILLGGDFVNGNGKCITPDKLLKALDSLSAPLGVYAVPGNHDYRYDLESVEAAFEKSNIRLLRDDGLQLTVNANTHFNLIGLDHHQNPHRRMERDRLRKLFSDNCFNLTFTHTPLDWEYLPDNANLTLAGHTHGGQINIPFLGSLINPEGHGRNLSYGKKHCGNKTLYITSGLSSAYNRARFCMKPEILLITLKSPDKK